MQHLDEFLAWLDSAENPAVRYLAARELPELGVGAQQLETRRLQMLAWRPLRRILALQQDDGSFPCRQKTPTAESSFYALMLMERCGMDVRDEPVRRAVEFVCQRHLVRGAFSYTRGGSGVLPCYVGVFTRALLRLTGHEHPAVSSSIDWILDHQRFDHKESRAGGEARWPYKAVDNHGGCW